VSPPRPRSGGSGWGSQDWPDGFPAAKPIAVEGGLVARSTRGGIGEQWWSRRFIEVMESFALGGRLTRGRNYARKGQVISVEVAPGEVTALVQGSRVTPYKVRVGLARFTELIWAKAEVVLAEQAIHSARLLAGEFPPELESVFGGIGAPLFPARLGDLKMSCSCPDPVIPCKHLAAAFYLLAEHFDDDPFLILRWRGRPREELLDRLRRLRADEDPDPGSDADHDLDADAGSLAVPAATTPGPVLSAALALDGLRPDVHDLDLAVSGFWTAGDTPSLPTHPELPVDLLLRLLPVPPAGLGGGRLLALLGPLYEDLPAGPASGPPLKPSSKPASGAASGARAKPRPETGAPDVSVTSGPARSTRRAGKTPETH
jgi:uncharacterized Zn finger protein